MDKIGVMEIERKFLVKNKEFMNLFHESFDIMQGYFFSNEKMSARIRKQKTFETTEYNIVVKVNDKYNDRREGDPIMQMEYVVQVPTEEGEKLLAKCENIVEKTRYIVNYEGDLYEVDVFHGKNEGLIIAEIELQWYGQEFKKPKWLGDEVTLDRRYSNAYIAEFSLNS